MKEVNGAVVILMKVVNSTTALVEVADMLLKNVGTLAEVKRSVLLSVVIIIDNTLLSMEDTAIAEVGLTHGVFTVSPSLQTQK